MSEKTQPYQPFTGQPCSCRPGIERDNCPACEGTGKRIDFAAIRARRAEPASFDIRATLRRVLPEGSTIWTVTQHTTRSGRVTVLPMAFMADPRRDPSLPGAAVSLNVGIWGGAVVASRRYVEFCEKLGYGEDASGSIVAALSMAVYDRPDAYSLGRTA